ncbi:MAG: ABC transporter substrate-binding protein [Clostridia bacterium]|jgi:iron complex transport system substrate-binding protein|nr:ABC transporter substrate-binding protein [Clostridia bacterium]MDH7573793.1 ABC transporter substrate-binding protein [Clostridia bacterium]
MRKLNRRAVIRRFTTIVLLLIILAAVAGCNGTPGSETDRKAITGTTHTVTVTDTLGRQVKVPARIERIACLCPFSGDAAVMLGQGDKIVAVIGGLKREVLLTEICPAVKSAAVPRVSGTINIEELIRCDPDVVFVKNDTALNEAEVDKLNRAGLTFVVVDFRSMEEQRYAMRLMGQVLGASEEAEEYNRYYESCLERVRKVVEQIPAEQRVRVYHSLNEATRTDYTQSLPADWTQAAGAINVSVNQQLKLVENEYYATLEQILQWDPDVIICNEPATLDYIMSNEQWSPLKAVKSRKVYLMPIGVSRWGHFSSLETPLAVLWTAKTLYPDRFRDLDMVAETKFFYRQFFDLELSDEMVSQILSGEGLRLPKQAEAK